MTRGYNWQNCQKWSKSGKTIFKNLSMKMGEMNMTWTKEMFGVEKPIIALLHLQALPGDPLYGGDMEGVYRQALEDLNGLQDGGVDGVLIANEFSLPYQINADPVTIGAMGYLVQT